VRWAGGVFVRQGLGNVLGEGQLTLGPLPLHSPREHGAVFRCRRAAPSRSLSLYGPHPRPHHYPPPRQPLAHRPSAFPRPSATSHGQTHGRDSADYSYLRSLGIVGREGLPWGGWRGIDRKRCRRNRGIYRPRARVSRLSPRGRKSAESFNFRSRWCVPSRLLIRLRHEFLKRGSERQYLCVRVCARARVCVCEREREFRLCTLLVFHAATFNH
jgi:hypothetical protein